MNGRLLGVNQTSVGSPNGVQVTRLHGDISNALAVVLEAKRWVVPVLCEENVNLEVRRDLIKTAHVLKPKNYALLMNTSGSLGRATPRSPSRCLPHRAASSCNWT